MRVNSLKIIHKENLLVDISFELKKSLALVGQSGSGKSLTLKSLLGMLPDMMRCELDYDANFKLIAGKSIAFVPQNPFTALSPLTKIKNQFFIPKQKQIQLFKSVDLEPSLLDRFPPELSGGQLQRIVIAMALESNPELLLLDEPTTALDPKNRVLILELLKKLQKTLAFKILFVTHDMNSAKSLCEDICVIKDGRVVENGKMSDVLNNPKRDYTKILIDSNFLNREFRQ